MMASPARFELDPQNLESSFKAILASGQRDEAFRQIANFMVAQAENFDAIRPAFDLLGGTTFRESDHTIHTDQETANDIIVRYASRDYPDYFWQYAVDTLLKIGTPDSVLRASRGVFHLYQSTTDTEPHDEPTPLDRKALNVISALKNIRDTGKDIEVEDIALGNITEIAKIAKHMDVIKSCISVFVERGAYSRLALVTQDIAIQKKPSIIPYVLESVGQRNLPDAEAAKEIKRPILRYGTAEDKKQFFAWLVQVADSDDQNRDTAIEELFQGFETSAVIEALSQMENNPRANDKLFRLSSAPGFILPATSALQAKFARAVGAGQDNTMGLEAQVRGALKDVMGEIKTHLQKPEDATALRAIFDTAIAQGMMEESDKEIIDDVNANIAQQWIVDAESERLNSIAKELQQRIGKLSL